MKRLNDEGNHHWREHYYAWEVRPTREKAVERQNFSTETPIDYQYASEKANAKDVEEIYFNSLLEEAKKFSSVEIADIGLGREELIKTAQKFIPEKLDKINRQRLAHSDPPLEELSVREVLDYLYGVDKVIRIGNKLYFIDLTTGKTNVIAKKGTKMAGRENLFRSIGAEGAAVITWRRKELPTTEDGFNFLWALEEASAFVLDIRFLD